MRRLLAALVLAVPCAAAAAPSLESAAAGSLSSFATAALPSPSARLVAAARRPMAATIDGAFSGQTASLAIDRRAWTVTGALAGREVKVAIDNAASTITGGANGAAVDLTFAWTPERVAYKGAANQSSVDYAIDWTNGVLDGTANGSPVHIEFSLANGTVDSDKSYANGWPVTLTYDPVSGKLAGALGGRNVALTMVNADLSDFLQNLYLFLQP
ncbi:MAG: hypothetical protein KGJ84_10165 [Elusimicrobia bacterium]|nr:hypothetical protein [Elusimicrobiota bacterium]